MINETLRKNINVDKENILPISTFKEGDNAILKLALFKNSTEFDITGQTVRLGAKTKGGLIEQIDGFTISKNNLDIKLKNSILVPGKIEIDLEIKDSNGSMTTASFFITVNQKVLNDEAVEATNEFDTFTKTVDKIESDYTGLRRIIIDENQATSLQDQINNINSSLDNNTNELNNLKTHCTGGNAMQEHSHINKTVLDKFSEVDNKLLYNGKPIEGGNSDNSGNSNGGISTDFDTEITLPFTPLSNTDVQLTFSPSEIVTYDLEVGNLKSVDGWTVTYTGENTLEVAEYKGKKCVHFSKDPTTTAYATISSINPNERKLDKSHKYYSRADICLISDGASSSYPKIYGASSFSTQIDLTKLNEWQSFSAIQTPTNSTNIANLRFILDGEAYFTGILVDLTLNSLETKSIEELNSMYENGEFSNNNMEFSCIVQNGNISTTITPFTVFGETKVFNVSAGSTLSIVKNEGYNLPNVVAKIKSTNSNIGIEDVDFIINTRFRGKKAVFEGDSITDNDYLPAYNNKSWASYLQEKLKLGECYNGAVGGSSISTYNSSGSVVNRIKSTNYPIDTKLFIVFAGTNDWNANVELGTVDSTDETTILGALNVIIDTIQTKCPDTTIVIMTPMQRSGTRTATRASGTLMDIAKAYEELCMNWGVNYFNTLKEFGFNAYNKTVANKYYCEQNSNELHPNPAGHKRIAVRMAGFISTL